MNEKTKVIFRKFPDAGVVALFPEESASCLNDWEFSSYMHIGQHSAATHALVYGTRLAKPDEYESLKKELEEIGYELEVRKRFTPQMGAVRKAAFENFAKEGLSDD